MCKEITLQVLDAVGVVEGEIKMKTSTITQIGRNRLALIDGDKVIGFLKVIDDGEGNIINIELDEYITN
jgi:hypothetical protein